MRPDRHVFPAQRRIAALDDADDISGRRRGGGEPNRREAKRATCRPRTQRQWIAAEEARPPSRRYHKGDARPRGGTADTTKLRRAGVGSLEIVTAYGRTVRGSLTVRIARAWAGRATMGTRFRRRRV